MGCRSGSDVRGFERVADPPLRRKEGYVGSAAAVQVTGAGHLGLSAHVAGVKTGDRLGHRRIRESYHHHHNGYHRNNETEPSHLQNLLVLSPLHLHYSESDPKPERRTTSP